MSAPSNVAVRPRSRSSHATGRAYRALSYGFRVRTDLTELDAYLDALLAPFRSEGVDGAPTYVIRTARRWPPYRVHLGGRLVLRSPSIGSAVDWVLWHVSTQAVGTTDDFLALHAGAVARRGQGVVLPAPADSGKTTLAAALTRDGFAYLTDEAALIDPRTGWIHPFPRALWMESASVDILLGLRRAIPEQLLGRDRPQYHIRPDDLRPRSIGQPCPVGFVVAPSYARGSGTALEPMSRAEAVVTLAKNSFNLDRFGRRGVALLVDLVQGAQCFRLPMGDLDSAVSLVRQLVGGK